MHDVPVEPDWFNGTLRPRHNLVSQVKPNVWTSDLTLQAMPESSSGKFPRETVIGHRRIRYQNQQRRNRRPAWRHQMDRHDHLQLSDSPSDYSANYYGNGEPTTSGFPLAPVQMQPAINYAGRPDLRLHQRHHPVRRRRWRRHHGGAIACRQSDLLRLLSVQRARPAATSGSAPPTTIPGALGNYYFTTALHELGHAFGLKHSQETGGVANVAVPIRA